MLSRLVPNLALARAGLGLNLPIFAVASALAIAAGRFIGQNFDFELAYAGVIGAIVALIAWPWLSMSSGDDFFEPKRIFPLIFGAFSVPALIGIYQTEARLDIGFDPYYVHLFGERLDTTTFVAALLCLLGLASFYIGYSVPAARRIARRLPTSNWEPNPATLVLGSLFLLLMAALLTVRFVGEFGGIEDYISLGYTGVRAESNVPTLLSASLGLSSSAITLFYFSARILKRRYLIWIAYGLISIYALYMMSVGYRRALLFLGVAVVLLEYYLRARRPRFLTVLLGLVMLSGTLSVVGTLRGYTISEYPDQIESIIPRFLSIALTSPFHSAEGQAPFLAFPTMLRAVPERMPYRFGLTYFQWIPSLVPRAVWPSKPLPLSLEYMQVFHPGTFAGFAFFFLAESVVNFGPLGPVIIMFIIGIVLRTLYEAFRLNSSSPNIVLMYSLFLAFLPSLLRVDSTAIAEFLREYLLPIAVVLFVSNQTRRGQS